VVRNLIVIGAACSRVSQALRDCHPEIPWADIVAFRNILVHAYFGIDWDIVWQAASRQVPDLASQLATIPDRLPPAARD